MNSRSSPPSSLEVPRDRSTNLIVDAERRVHRKRVQQQLEPGPTGLAAFRHGVLENLPARFSYAARWGFAPRWTSCPSRHLTSRRGCLSARPPQPLWFPSSSPTLNERENSGAPLGAVAC